MTAFHASFRFFSVTGGDAEEWWFGGSCDMTPAYGSEANAVHFHTTLKAWCDRHPRGRHASGRRPATTTSLSPTAERCAAHDGRELAT
jgi:coproporphyrinogen III oxidase